MDMQAGISAWYQVSELLQFDAGVALDHIREPKETFYVSNNQLSRKVSIYLSSHIRKEIIRFSPGAIYLTQSGNHELIFGSDVHFIISGFTLGGGLWYRWNRDIIPSVRMASGRFELTFCYDTNISVMHPASLYRGGMEMSLRITLDREKTDKYDCDEMKF